MADTLVESGTLSELEVAVGAEVALQLIEMFLDSGSKRIDELRDAVDDSDASRAAEILHSLKSSAWTLGAALLAGLAEQAEQLALKKGPVDELAALMPAIAEASERTTEYLRSYRERLR